MNVFDFTICENVWINRNHFRENGKSMLRYQPVRQSRLKAFQQMVAKGDHIFFISSLQKMRFS